MKHHTSQNRPSRIRRRIFAGSLVLTFLTCGLALSALAEDSTERAARGQVTYRVYCMNCHGQAGEGDGPLAELLKVPPTDLSRLALANEDEFPAEDVYAAIDGREDVRTHGSREMPVWGIGLQDRSRDADQEEEVRERILDLVAHIESIQKSE